MRPTGSVAVGPFRVADLSRSELCKAIVDGYLSSPGSSFVAVDLHVGALNLHRDEAFASLVNQADVAYADGMSVVWLARLAGATKVQKSTTTDLGWEVLHELHRRLGRPLSIGLIGGPPGLSRRAGDALGLGVPVAKLFDEHGYHSDWSDTITRLREEEPDVLLVGMGIPREVQWVSDHRVSLPPALVLTCGGWFGFLAGEEARAPLWLQRVGGEWLFRVAQSPRRLAGRYLQGASTTCLLALKLGRRRLGGTR